VIKAFSLIISWWNSLTLLMYTPIMDPKKLHLWFIYQSCKPLFPIHDLVLTIHHLLFDRFKLVSFLTTTKRIAQVHSQQESWDLKQKLKILVTSFRNRRDTKNVWFWPWKVDWLVLCPTEVINNWCFLLATLASAYISPEDL